ncbi:MAG: hypothetical protein KDC44_10305, partial [Phaeodactylibacter sp.]|nr:hypothetical protein [Phaeodactylibacter sp.]
MRQKNTLVTGLLALLTLTLSGQQPFYSETFNQGGWPAGWTTEDVSENGPTKKLEWAICSEPQLFPPSACAPSRFSYFQEAFPDAVFGATTAADGYLYADSDSALINTGLPHISQLTSPAINCQAYDAVFLQFESHLAYHEAEPDTNAILLASTDGINWDTFQLFPTLDVNPDLDIVFTLNPVPITVDLTETAAGQSSVYLRWQWRGFLELCWAIDDVHLYAENPAHYRAVWGNQPGEGDFDEGLNDWEIYPNAPINSWKWEAVGQLGTGLLAPSGFYLSSPSQFNGMMTFNADLYSTDGMPPVPMPLPIYDSELWSPVIDLSGTDAPLSLRFAQLFRPFNPVPGGCPTVSAIAFSYDGGDSWSACRDVNPGPVIPDFWNDSIRVLPLPAEAVGASEFRFKFIFNGTLFGWAIDDVVIFERPEHDLKLDGRYFAKAPNIQTPKTMVESLYFLVDAANVGQDTQYNVKVFIEVDQADGTQYFLDSILIDTMIPEAVVENLLFSQSFLPNSGEIGRFKCRYFIEGENDDQEPSNNTLYWEFAVTENTLAKELRPTAAFAPANQQNYRYGSCYYIPEDAENLFATTITFGLGNVPPGILEEVGTFL